MSYKIGDYVILTESRQLCRLLLKQDWWAETTFWYLEEIDETDNSSNIYRRYSVSETSILNIAVAYTNKLKAKKLLGI